MDSLKEERGGIVGSDAVVYTGATRMMNLVPHEGIHDYKMYENDNNAFILPVGKASKM